MLRTAARRNEILARTLIEDARFDELNWKSLEVLAKAVNSWTGQEVVAAKEMESAWSPLGFDFFMRDFHAPLRFSDYSSVGDLYRRFHFG